jgi:hypothetical protein
MVMINSFEIVALKENEVARTLNPNYLVPL